MINIIRSSLSNIKSNKQLFLFSITTNFIAFSVLSLFFLMFFNLNILFSTWDKHVQLIVYLNDDTSRKNKNNIERLFETNKHIESVVFISREQAWKNIQIKYSAGSNFITSLDFNPLPDSYVIKFKDEGNRLKHIKDFSVKIVSHKGVESIEYGEKWISRFEHFIIFLRGFIATFGVILLSGMILIVANTIKLSIYTRKEEINLMSLLGATNRFIKSPLLLEGVLQGISGSLLALAAVKLIHLYIVFKFQGSLESTFRGVEVQFLSYPLIYSLIFAGVIIGFIGSLFAVNQFLAKPDIE